VGDWDDFGGFSEVARLRLTVGGGAYSGVFWAVENQLSINNPSAIRLSEVCITVWDNLEMNGIIRLGK